MSKIKIKFPSGSTFKKILDFFKSYSISQIVLDTYPDRFSIYHVDQAKNAMVVAEIHRVHIGYEYYIYDSDEDTIRIVIDFNELYDRTKKLTREEEFEIIWDSEHDHIKVSIPGNRNGYANIPVFSKDEISVIDPWKYELSDKPNAIQPINKVCKSFIDFSTKKGISRRIIISSYEEGIVLTNMEKDSDGNRNVNSGGLVESWGNTPENCQVQFITDGDTIIDCYNENELNRMELHPVIFKSLAKLSGISKENMVRFFLTDDQFTVETGAGPYGILQVCHRPVNEETLNE